MITSISQLDLKKRYTVEDYFSWNLKERVEIIKGKIFKMSPAPTYDHQKISGQLYGYFWNETKGFSCEVFSAPIDVMFPNISDEGNPLKDTVVQPDIIVVCDKDKLQTNGCHGAPDIIVEILSPSTTRKDLSYKYDLYEENGVEEYWVVYPSDSTVQIYGLVNRKYELLKEYNTIGDIVKSTVLSNIEIPIEEIFKGLKNGSQLQEPKVEYNRL